MLVGSRDKRKLTHKVKLKKGRSQKGQLSEKYGDIERNPPLYLGHY